MIILFLSVHSLKAQEKFKTSTWQETITFIQQHKDSLLNFHYYTPKTTQTVVLKDSVLIVKVLNETLKYIHKAHFKNLKQVRNYKENGLLLTFGWKNVDFTTYDILKNHKKEESKSMHFGVRINNTVIKKSLKNAFNRLVVLNDK
jgi:hypothetical protein